MQQNLNAVLHRANIADVDQPIQSSKRPGIWMVRRDDIVWLALFGLMAWATPSDNVEALLSIGLFAISQLIEGRVPWFSTQHGVLTSIAVKILLGWFLIGWTDGINSTYYPILLAPVITAATRLGWLGTSVVTLAACSTYLYFLRYIDFSIQSVSWKELALHLGFLPVAGYLTYILAETNREGARLARSVAGQLEVANRSLQEAEAAVRRSDRLAALGQLTAGLAHELRNPLGTIRASSEMLRKSLTGNESEVAAEMAGFIQTEVDRANSLVTRFLEFARPLPLRRAAVSLADMLDRAISQFEHAAPQPDVSIYKNYSPEIPPLEIDAEWMERVVYNLLMNAAQASPAGSAVTVKTRLLDDHRQAEISVIDRGSGIDPKNRENIFNPFFTTKPDGVGLGLAIVSKVIDEHGGQILVESELGKGSIFRVLLPLKAPMENSIQ